MSNYEIIQLFIGIFVTSVVAVLKLVYNKILSDINFINKELSVIEKEITRIEIETSKNYLEKQEFRYTFEMLSKRFEKIMEKLENKSK